MKAKSLAISIRFPRNQERALRVIADRDRHSLADTVRRLTEQAMRQRGPDIRKLLDAEPAR